MRLHLKGRRASAHSLARGTTQHIFSGNSTATLQLPHMSTFSTSNLNDTMNHAVNLNRVAATLEQAITTARHESAQQLQVPSNENMFQTTIPSEPTSRPLYPLLQGSLINHPAIRNDVPGQISMPARNSINNATIPSHQILMPLPLPHVPDSNSSVPSQMLDLPPLPDTRSDDDVNSVIPSTLPMPERRDELVENEAGHRREMDFSDETNDILPGRPPSDNDASSAESLLPLPPSPVITNPSAGTYPCRLSTHLTQRIVLMDISRPSIACCGERSQKRKYATCGPQ